ncbi:hypothetical protein SteCoe_33430 [Stentor coeruleus]|uniref:Casein kinase substrate phosphoprotein PP28 domain-containing protein n=1 Tax=Stentor coeruleus TaxID=5963 RepID=A0A1R2AWS4_9CILI|nr:hypothetical protein SteCoe_33430 [Stentor coeruleus]
MPKDGKGKNKKWSRHVERDQGFNRMEELEEKAARLGVEVWQLREQENSSDEEKQEEIKEAANEESGSESDDATKGNKGLIEINNPNRLRPLKKSDFRTEEEMADSKKAQKNKAISQVGDLQRLQEVRARREAAAKQREEQKAQRDTLKEEAKKGTRKRQN